MGKAFTCVKRLIRSHKQLASVLLIAACAVVFVSLTLWGIRLNLTEARGNKPVSAVSAYHGKAASLVALPSSSQPPLVAVQTISLNKEALTMSVSGKFQLTAVVAPDNAADKTVQWSSSSPGTADCDQTGRVTAKKAGTAAIYATASDGVQAKCQVTVSAPQAQASTPPATVAPPPAPATFHGSVFDGTSQVIVVTANGMNTIVASLSTYQETNGSWNKMLSAAARVGKYGLVYDSRRVEGDLRTPVGVYTLPYAFGTAPNPGVRMPYKPVDAGTYYDGQYGSPTYNDFVEVQPASEYEYMDIGPYQYGVDIGFNLSQTPGKGNAIFLHCSTASGYTAGCVSVSPGNLFSILQWLDPAQNPKILLCPASDLPNYYS